jgi:pimeloyl-ACP methyl ester carboxylesterase
MGMPFAEKTIRTAQARIAVRETSGSGLPVVMIHGNSSCKEVFANQLDSRLGEMFRLIAIDLPGHGASGNAREPATAYTMPGYAEAVVEVLHELGVTRAAVFGWSLGGHVAIEMMPRFPGMTAMMIAGTPPVSPTPESIQSGFRPHPLMLLLGKDALSDEEITMMDEGFYGASSTPALKSALRRTDPVARPALFANLFAGGVSDQKALVQNSEIPVAIVNGATDPIINTEYIEGLSYRNLWDEHCFALRGAGHAPFLTHPQVFNPIFERFVVEVSQLAARPSGAKSKVAAA